MGKELFRLKLKSLAYVSSVDTPAQETAVARLIKRKGGQAITATARVAKLSDELGLVFGWALTTKADGVSYYDLHGDNIVEDDLIKIAAEWMSAGGAADTMHDREQDGRAVFCMPMTTEVAKAVYGDKIGGELGTYGLLVAIKPSPEDFAKFKSGELTGFSIDGTGIREPVRARKAAPVFALGDRVEALVDHMPGMAGMAGKVTTVRAGEPPYYGVTFDDQTAMPGEHKWLAEDEIEAEAGSDAAKRLAARARKSADKRYLTDEVDGHQHEAFSFDNGEPWMNDATAAGAQGSHRHIVVRQPDGSLTVLADSGHTHTLTEQPKVVVVDEGTTAIPEEVAARATPRTVDNAKRAANESPRSQKSQNVNLVIKENAVDPTQELADLKTLQGKLTAKIAELEAQLADATAQASLTDGEKAHLATLAGAEAKRFVALEKTARLAEVEKANEVAHTCIDGTVIRKSDGALALRLAKQSDEALRTAQAEKSARETVELTKRAGETIGKLAGKTAVHVALLKAAEAIEGEIEIDGKKLKLADEAVKTLKAANDAMTERSKAAGFGSHVEQDDGPQGELDALVAKYANDNKVDASKARLEVVKTSEGRRLYGEIEDLRKRASLGGR